MRCVISLLNEGLPVTESSFLNNVKETPGLHIVGDLFECSCNHKIFLPTLNF